jgi:hypothetical protein
MLSAYKEKIEIRYFYPSQDDMNKKKHLTPLSLKDDIFWIILPTAVLYLKSYYHNLPNSEETVIVSCANY